MHSESNNITIEQDSTDTGIQGVSKQPGIFVSSLPLLVLTILLSITITTFGADSLAGPSQVALMVATATGIVLAIWKCDVKWNDIEDAMSEKVRNTAVSVYILFIIGCLGSAWMVSGIVPTLICYGIEVIRPSVFLASACVISGIVSLMTGSSWTTIATIGIALLGIGRALGFDDGWTAGAIISGAYFGDKISPLSDTTVLASSVSGTPIFWHIRYMLLTTTPTLLITLCIFGVAGLVMGLNTHTDTIIYSKALNDTYTITPWLLLVPLLTGVLIYKKVPSLVVLFTSTVMAIVMAVIFQQDVLLEIAKDKTGIQAIFSACVTTLCSRTNVDTGNALLNELVTTDGMAGMLDTIWLILCAMAFGGVMTASGMLKCFLHAIFSRLAKTRLGLVLSTVLSGMTLNLTTGDQYISIILSADLFKDEYQRQGYESRLLSRTCEDSATVTSVLVPWNTCGMTQSTVLGVSTITYLPYCFFNLISPLMTLLHAAFGWKIKRCKVK